MGVVAAAVAAVFGSVPSSAGAQGPVACGYGTGGPFASNLCWFDMSAYDDAQARSANGQQISVSLEGGYTAEFTITSRPVAGAPSHPGVESRAVPLETRFAFGSPESGGGRVGGYVGTPGEPALYSLPQGAGTRGVELTLSDITVTDSSGAAVTGYRFVIADAENNINGENFTWTSDKPLDLIGVVNPAAPTGCESNLAGVGTTSVTCTGTGGEPGLPNPRYDAVVVGADTPSTIGLSMTTFARSGVAFAIMTSKIEVRKNVAGRVQPTDSFDVTATSPEGSTIASASTGSSNSATTGELTVLPRTNGASYTLSESATPASGTQLSEYTQDWSCTNNGGSDPSLPSGGGTSVQVSPEAGDDIQCTVTNTAPPADLSITKQSDGAPHMAGQNVAYTLTVENNGPDDAGGVEVTDDLPASLSVVSVTPEQGSCSQSDPIDCDLGTIPNGDSVQITVVASIDAGAGGNPITNTATVTSVTPDNNSANNSGSDTIQVDPEPSSLSYFAKHGSDSATNSTAVSGGPAGTTAGGNVIDWVLSYRNQTGLAANVNITDPITGNHDYVQGSLRTPPGLAPQWSTNGGMSYVGSEPALGTNAVGATGTSVAGSTGAQVQASPPPPSAVPAAGAGDGFEPLFVGANVYNVFHHRGGMSGANPITVLDCHVRMTGAQCPGYPTYVSPNAGDPFGTGPSTLTTATFDQAAVSGNKIYYPVGVIGTRDDGVVCANVVTQTSCGFFQLGSYTGSGVNGNNTSATINGGASMGSRYYTVSHDGEIYCFDVSTETTCQGYAPAVSDPTAPALRTWPFYNLQAWDDRYLFGIFARPGTNPVRRDVICIDVTTDTRCPGFPKIGGGGIVSGSLHNSTMVPILDSSGDVTGICAVDASNFTEHPFNCFDLNGNDVPTPFSETQTTGTVVNAYSFGSVAVVGTRVYFAETVQSTRRATYTCWDYSATPSAPGKIGNVCPNFIAATTNQNVAVYTIRQDPQNPECLWSLGDSNRFEIFSATFGGTGCRFGSAFVELEPEDFYCDGAGGHVSAWDAIRLSGLTSADYNGLSVTITDANGDAVPGWQNRSISNASQTIDISSIPYSGSTTELEVAVAISWGSHAVKPVTVTTTFEGDPPQVCFQTRVGDPECTTAQQITNDANAITNAGAGNTDAPAGNDSGPATFNVPADPQACRTDLEIEKATDDPDGVVSPGDPVEWTLTVTNNGTDDSTGSTVTDTLPQGVSNVATQDPRCDVQGNLITCDIGALASGDSTDIVVTAIAPGATATCFENAASVEADEPDPEPDNDEATTRTCTTPAADLRIEKSASQQLVGQGAQFQYTLSVFNDGPDDSTGSTVTDTLPAGVNVIAYNQNDCDLQGQTLTCEVGPLATTQSQAYVILVEAPNTPSTCFENVASIEGEEGDPDLSDNETDAVRVCTTPAADLRVSKSGPADVDPGGQVSYTLEINNNGPDAATGVVVTDTLPSGLTNIQAPGCNVQGQTVTCNIGALPPNNLTNILITADAPNTASTCFENVASIEGDESDPDLSNNESDSVETCTRESDLEIAKAVTNDLVSAGDPLEYTLTVTNNGPDRSTASTITDTLPPELSNVATQDPRCTVQGNQVECTIGPLDDGDSTDIVISADAPQTTSTCVDNTATVDGSEADPTASNDEATVRACTTPVADLELEKSADAEVDPGGQVTWTLTVTNNGPDASTGSTVTDTLPQGVSNVATQDSRCDVQGNSVSCDISGLGDGDSTDIVITGTAPNAASNCFENAGAVEGEEGDPDLSDNEDSAETCTNEGADLEITKVAEQGPFSAGDNVTYTLTVTNNGPATAHDAEVSDDLPSSLTLVSATPDQGTCNAADPIDCDLGTLADGDSVEIEVVATIGSDQSGNRIENTACVEATEPDEFSPNDCATEPINVEPESDIRVSKVADAGPFRAGEDVTYTVTVTNDGPNTAHNVEVSDDLPATLTLVSATPQQGTCNAADPLECQLGTMDSGDTVEIEVVATIAGDQSGNQIENTACAAGDEADPDASNDCDTEPVDIVPEADLAIAKVAQGGPFSAGGNVTYQLTVTNNGPNAATDVEIADDLPGTLTFVSATPSQGTCNSADPLDCDLGTIADGGDATIDLVATIGADQSGNQIDNTACAETSTLDPDSANDCDTEPIDVDPEADLAITKTVDPAGRVDLGQRLTYTLTVENLGPNDATDVTVTDEFQKQAQVLKATPSQGTCQGAKPITCDLGMLANGGQATIVVVARPLHKGKLRNEATVTSPVRDRDPSNNDDDATTRTRPGKVEVTKRANRERAGAGDIVTYHIDVRSKSPVPLRNLKVCDNVPKQLKLVAAPGADIHGNTACWRFDLGPRAKKSVEVRAKVKPSRYPLRVKNTAKLDGGDVQPARDREGIGIKPSGVPGADPCPAAKTTARRC